jgi:ADP-ribose pyrophosphatase YjhB (NUDIX family)
VIGSAPHDRASDAAEPPRDNDAYRFPVSVKGIVVRDGAVVVVHNRRDEWELPGGKLEIGESPERCVARVLVDAWVYDVAPGTQVLVLTYGCAERSERTPIVSPEHTRLAWIALDEIDGLHMPDGYKSSIVRWVAATGARVGPRVV